MPARPESAVRLVRAAAFAVGLGERPDSELLTAFLADDAAAFEALVRRHGPMVLRTCRIATRCEADADDAFQATFVLLYRKAATVRNQRSLAGWLFRVARRAAANARRAADRRACREATVERPTTEPGPDLSWREACAVLHAELDRLPETYRLPLVLCYLQGLSRDEAAHRLGWSLNEVRGRLERGRLRLRARLEKRGIALTAGLLSAVAADGLPPTVVQAAVSCAGRPSARVAELVAATAAVRAKVVAGFAVAAAVVVGAVVLGAGPGAPPADPPAKEKPAAQPARLDAHGDPLPDGAVARLGTVRFNHGEGLRVVRYTPDGRSLVSVGNGWARVWDAESGLELRQFPIAHVSWKDEAVVSPNGKTLIHLHRFDRTDPLGVYDLGTGQELWKWSLPGGGGVTYTYLENALSPDGRLALVNTARARRVFDTATAEELCQIGPDREVRREGALVLPDRQSVAFAGPERVLTVVKGGPIEVWDARSGTRIREFTPDGRAVLLVPTPDGKFVATIDDEYTYQKDRLDPDVAQVWDLTTGKRVQRFESQPKSWYRGVAFAPDGRTLVTVTTSNTGALLTRWEVGTGRRVWEVDHDGGNLLAVSPDGKRLTTGISPGRLTVRDFETGRLVSSDEPAHARAAGLHLSRTGDRVVTVGYQSVLTWDGATGRRLQSFPVPYLGSVAAWRVVSPRGRYAATLSQDGDRATFHVFDTADGRELVRRPLGVPPSWVTVAFTPDESRVAVRVPGAEVATIRVLDLPSGKETLAIQDPRTKHPGILFVTTDGRTLVVAGHRLVGYSLADGAEQFSCTIDADVGRSGAPAESAGWRTLALSPDGSLGCCVLSRGIGGPSTIPDRLLLFDARTGKALHRWSDSDKGGRTYEALAFSADGRLVASSDGYDVRLWEVATGREVRTLRGHRGEMEALAFSGNGRRLASASWDSTVLIWDLSVPPTDDPLVAWAALAGDDAAAAWSAVWRLADAPDEITIPLLRRRLRPVTPTDVAWIARLVANLDSDEFQIRARALKDLSDLGHVAKPALAAARTKGPSAEAAARLDQLLSKVVGPPSSGESLRTWRALAVLEAKGTPAARALLDELAAGAGGWLTNEAKAAARRLER